MSDKPVIITPDGLNQDNNRDYFGYKFVCNNCRHINDRYVLKRTQTRGLSIECDNCECKVKS